MGVKKLLPLILLLILSCEEVLQELADTTSPTVVITYPPNNSTLDSIATVRADVTDDSDIDFVQFIIDGRSDAFADSTAPYEYEWDVCVQASGTHTLMVKATDSAGNQGQSELYSFRHSYAIRRITMLNGNVFEVMREMGHTNTQTTMQYLRFPLQRRLDDFPSLQEYVQNPQEMQKSTIMGTKIMGTNNNNLPKLSGSTRN